MEKTNLIQIFEKVQKIPYRVCKFSKENIDENLKYGDCRHKSELLYKLLKREGYKVKKTKVIFNWRNLEIPKSLLSILKNSGTIWDHDSISIKINNKWIRVDCTWNPKLKNKGFPITENWDGKSDTKQITEGKLKFYDLKGYSKKIKINKNEAMEFAKKLNKYLN